MEQGVWLENKENRESASPWAEENMMAQPAQQEGNTDKAAREAAGENTGKDGKEGNPADVPPFNGGAFRRENQGDTEETRRMKDNFDFFGPAAFLYGVFYVFCMFRNGSGITYPLFVGGSLLVLYLSLSKLGMSLKKGSAFYMSAMMLLGISTFCTDDGRIIFLNKLGCFLLMMSLLLKQFYHTEGWRFGKFLGSICVMVFGSIGEWNRPVADAAAYKKNGAKKRDKKIWYVGLGLLAGIPLMLVILLLLASADAVFRQMTKRLWENLSLYNICSVLVQIVFVYFVSYGLTAWLCGRKLKEETADRRKGEPVLAITITSLPTVLYLLFSGIQIGGLFLGRLSLPFGYTYAMYAREGFFQLLAVSILNLIIVLVCMSFFRESRVLKVILLIMSLCTFVMIASSALRMIMYIRYYYLTFLRILVLWGLALLAVLFVGVTINIFKESFPLFRYSVAVAAVLYLGLSFAHPDYIIAKVNVANAVHPGAVWRQESGRTAAWQQWDGGRTAEQQNDSGMTTGVRQGGKNQGAEFGKEMMGGSFFLTSKPYEDYSYLRRLSADAAPVLAPYLKELGYRMEAFDAENAVVYAKDKDVWNSASKMDGFGYYWLERIQRRTENFSIRTFNVSRYLALRALRR